MSILSPFLDFLHDLFSTASRAVSALTLAAARALTQGGGDLLAEAAMTAVAAAEAKGGSGSDKFAAAKSSVIATLEAKGVPLVLNAIHLAVESAVAAAKSPK